MRLDVWIIIRDGGPESLRDRVTVLAELLQSSLALIPVHSKTHRLPHGFASGSDSQADAPIDA